MIHVSFAPLLPWAALGALAAAAAFVCGYALWRRARGAVWRLAAAAVLLAALANPVLIEEERAPNRDVAAVVVDESLSQRAGGRMAQTEEALAGVTERLGRLPGVETRVIRVGDVRGQDGTRLFEALERALADVPRRRVGATFLITDGQVHDAPAGAGGAPARAGPAGAGAGAGPPGPLERLPGPVHVLLSGGPDERDRRLVVEAAPRFGLVGKTVEVAFTVRDRRGGRARVSLKRDGVVERVVSVPVGREETLSFVVEHAGANILELEAEPVPGEIFDGNNRAVVQVNGVRERLRVLLVSGVPHAGERVWRNLLKADPSVDLVHFTILRPPEKQDSTPVRELALIAFPVRELFEEKIEDFDLIIFDRYRQRGILPGVYLENIVDYVRNGGAVLNAAGPGFASPLSLHRTALGDILPARPVGDVIERGLLPRVTEVGLRHPVTADLAGSADSRWGRWFRQVAAVAGRGRVLMSGDGDGPLLVLDRVGEGRVALLLSDHIWLWARGFEGGGPHSEILRRLAHWLMKEPGLEEEALRATVKGGEMVITSRSMSVDHPEVTVTAPSGASRTVALEAGQHGRARATLAVDEVGIHRLDNGRQSAVLAVGHPDPVEFADMRASPLPLAAAREASGGGLRWLRDGLPDIRRVRAGRRTAGGRWMGVVANRDYRVASVSETHLLPPLLVLLLGLGAMVWAWRREGG